MTAKISVNRLPEKKPETCVAQIHDGDHDVIEIIVSKSNIRVRFRGKTIAILESNYVLGKKFQISLVASKGLIFVYYKSMIKPAVRIAYSGSGNFFKVGNYLQSNVQKGDLPAAYAGF
jgi:hypothetical protein